MKKLIMIVMLISLCFFSLAFANDSKEIIDQYKYPVTLDGTTLFEIKAKIGSFTPEDRAKRISERLVKIGQNISLSLDNIDIKDSEYEQNIVIGNNIILTITNADAVSEHLEIKKLAQERKEQITYALKIYREERKMQNLAINILKAILATAFVVFLLKAIKNVLQYILDKLKQWIVSLEKKIKVVSEQQLLKFTEKLLRYVGYIIKVIVFYLYIYYILSLFPDTRQYSNQLLNYIVTPLQLGFTSFVAYLPNLLIICLILLCCNYILKFFKMIFTGIEKGKFNFEGFYPEWSYPTYQIVKFLIFAMTLVFIYPYMPGANSPIFQGVSVLVGLLFSFGSTSAISNIIAGISLTYTRAFAIGDRVKVGDNIGDVLEKTLLVTRIRTIKNVDISIPNSTIFNSPIINYSRAMKETNLILHTTITIGYDVPWRKVHELLIEAALAADGILKEPKPFVFQESLDDFAVSYQINAYTDKPNAMASIYSYLHQNIQDYFNEAAVEIMSPHYSALRDGNKLTMPQDSITTEAEVGAFNVKITNK